MLPLLTHSLLESDKLILAVDQSLCSNPAVVGGKAASLALLADVANTVLKNKVVESLNKLQNRVAQELVITKQTNTQTLLNSFLQQR